MSSTDSKVDKTRKGKGKDYLSPGSSLSLSSSKHWAGSGFSIPHDSVLDISEIPPLPAEIDIVQVPWWTSKRFQLSIICFFGSLVAQATRVCLSIAIVSMVADPRQSSQSVNTTNSINYTIIEPHHTPEGRYCPDVEKVDNIAGELHWNKKLQGLILGSFFWGYLLLQLFTGWLSARFGAKRVIGLSFIGIVLATMLSPVSARIGPYLFMAVRILLGIFQCTYYPSMQTLWTNWSPPHERSRLLGIAYAGNALGNAVVLPLGGILSRYGFDGGWPSVFYVIGMFSAIWTCIWLIFCYDFPSNHPTISTEEKKYIEFYLGIQDTATKRKNPVPFAAIIRSKAVYSIIVAHFCANFGNYLFTTQLPTYYKDVLKLKTETNGFYSMLPYLVLWILMLFAGFLADFIIMKNMLSILNTRKLMTYIGMVGPGLLLIGLGYMECDQHAEAITMVTLTIGLCAFHMSGFFVNMSDITPAYAGTIMSISNTFATSPGIIAPYIAGVLTTNGTRSEWQMTYYVSAGVLMAGSLFYGLLAEGEVQSWGHVHHIREEEIGLAVDDTTVKHDAKSINKLSTDNIA
ncbi:hypothetical protein LOTGIDRAFT_161420 [Lottia gigantea]|uniref:Major facilitator superfamily (MFS) profile domain-containing protein n=1 Tax=Lottia gigantea TaxID=225164 RepID=V4ABL8_LOTGI|nr:hypothetical protein LOTGIDRAFT_161420 [Lottia gigantea]ESO94212.1 hypothetical protein LOTGIDRAFT_161420 [Lottia gigantea]